MSDDWERRMSERAKARQAQAPDVSNRSNWPGPVELRHYSTRDAFLWYVAHAWDEFFGDDPPIERLFDHDFGLHVFRKGMWQLTFVNVEQFPADKFPDHEEGESVEDFVAETERRRAALRKRLGEARGG